MARRALLLLSFLGLAACEPRAHWDFLGTAVLECAGAGCSVSGSEATLDFGAVQGGGELVRTVRLSNVGVAPFELVSARSDHGAFSLSPTPATLGPEETIELAVLFRPTAAGAQQATLRIGLAHATVEELVLHLSGTGTGGTPAAGSCLVMAPNDHDYGVVDLDCDQRRDRTFTLSSACKQDVTLTEVSASGLPFLLIQRPVLPFVLRPGGTVDLKAAFATAVPGTFRGELLVVADALAYSITLAGEARPGRSGFQTDTFVQGLAPRADILVVVDDAGSMASHQASLRGNLDYFSKFVASQYPDFHFAVTSTDLCDPLPGCLSSSTHRDGRFFSFDASHPSVVTSAMPDAEQLMSDNLRVGFGGGTSARPLEAMRLALSNPNLAGNPGFLRDDVPLAVILVSDSDDQSAGTVAAYLNFVLSLKGFRRANLVSVSAILPTLTAAPVGCSTTGGASTRVREIVDRTGGVYDDLCTPDWARTLQKLAPTAFGFRTRFLLTKWPDQSTGAAPLEVTIDAAPYPRIGPRGEARWTYLPGDNSIDFEPLAVPEPGTTLTVTYHVACLP